MINNSTIWIEWVPNISVGRDPEFIRSVKEKFDSIPDLYILHTDQGIDVNRSVLTVVGTRNSLREGMLALLAMLEKNVSMRLHQGAHPRLGALDVSPFIPLNRKDQPKVIKWVKELAEEISSTFDFPVFLYEESASAPHRRNLADIRRGEYEGLETKIQDPHWKPDFGGSFHPGLGATVMGVRDFLIAYNVNLKTKDISVVRSIASQIRDRKSHTTKYTIPGLKAIGWHLVSTNTFQVSTNITATELATPLMVYEQCQRSEEHTSELQSRGHLVCRLLLEKKKHELRRPDIAGQIRHSNFRQAVLVDGDLQAMMFYFQQQIVYASTFSRSVLTHNE